MSMYIVTAPLVVARQNDGAHIHIYRDSPIPAETDPEQLAQLLSEGMVTEVDDPPADPPADPEESPKATRGRKADPDTEESPKATRGRKADPDTEG